MRKRKAPTTRGINSFFTPVGSTSSSNTTGAENVIPSEEQPVADNQTNDIPVDMQTDEQQVVAPEEVAAGEGTIESTKYVRDPGMRQQIWELPHDEQEEARRFYILKGAYQPYMREYPYNKPGKIVVDFNTIISILFLGLSIRWKHIVRTAYLVFSSQKSQVEGVALMHSQSRDLIIGRR